MKISTARTLLSTLPLPARQYKLGLSDQQKASVPGDRIPFLCYNFRKFCCSLGHSLQQSLSTVCAARHQTKTAYGSLSAGAQPLSTVCCRTRTQHAPRCICCVSNATVVQCSRCPQYLRGSCWSRTSRPIVHLERARRLTGPRQQEKSATGCKAPAHRPTSKMSHLQNIATIQHSRQIQRADSKPHPTSPANLQNNATI